MLIPIERKKSTADTKSNVRKDAKSIREDAKTKYVNSFFNTFNLENSNTQKIEKSKDQKTISNSSMKNNTRRDIVVNPSDTKQGSSEAVAKPKKPRRMQICVRKNCRGGKECSSAIEKPFIDWFHVKVGQCVICCDGKNMIAPALFHLPCPDGFDCLNGYYKMKGKEYILDEDGNKIFERKCNYSESSHILCYFGLKCKLKGKCPNAHTTKEKEIWRKKAEAKAERKRLAEEAEQKRLAEEAEQKRLAEEAEQKRLAEEAERKRLAEEAEQKRLEWIRNQMSLEEKRLADEAMAKRLEEEAVAEKKRLDDEAAAKKKRLEEEERLNEEKSRVEFLVVRIIRGTACEQTHTVMCKILNKRMKEYDLIAGKQLDTPREMIIVGGNAVKTKRNKKQSYAKRNTGKKPKNVISKYFAEGISDVNGTEDYWLAEYRYDNVDNRCQLVTQIEKDLLDRVVVSYCANWKYADDASETNNNHNDDETSGFWRSEAGNCFDDDEDDPKDDERQKPNAQYSWFLE